MVISEKVEVEIAHHHTEEFAVVRDDRLDEVLEQLPLQSLASQVRAKVAMVAASMPDAISSARTSASLRPTIRASAWAMALSSRSSRWPQPSRISSSTGLGVGRLTVAPGRRQEVIV